jgi:Transcriptional regulatory protein, C terminal
MNSPNMKGLRVGEWRVDPAIDEISKDGATVKLEPRAMRLLICLVERAGRVVSVEQLLDEVWKDVVVTPNSPMFCAADIASWPRSNGLMRPQENWSCPPICTEMEDRRGRLSRHGPGRAFCGSHLFSSLRW